MLESSCKSRRKYRGSKHLLKKIEKIYWAMVAQLRHQFQMGRLTIQGLWFHCQKSSADIFAGSAVLNLLEIQDLSKGIRILRFEGSGTAQGWDS
ncbi:hypothetical protein CMV_024979 [Castanea mollissima]|uniref:Uncharacterized protein n=1 Tax=Castanea mollissima TaxID=60419 RepID=A0A8J4QDD0_9ROSI|nr:hypothetical protein CMV_024979 [Castanea mollissima]